MKSLLRVGALVSLLLPRVGLGAGIQFPTKNACVSPDRLWLVRSQTEEQKDGSGLHRLFLSRLGSEAQTFVYASGRCCDVLWSAGGERFAITDWAGSNVSDIYLVEVSPVIVSRFEIPDISAYLLQTEREGHLYWEAMKWETPNRLLVRIFGHTDEAEGHGFTYFFSIDINSREAVLIRKTDEERTD